MKKHASSTKGYIMRTALLIILLIISMHSVEYECIDTGTKDDIQYKLFKKTDLANTFFIELYNRKKHDVKITLQIAGGIGEKGPDENRTYYCKAESFIPMNGSHIIKSQFKDPYIRINGLEKGVLLEKIRFLVISCGKIRPCRSSI